MNLRGLLFFVVRWPYATAALVVLAFYFTHLDFSKIQSGGDFTALFLPGRFYVQQCWAEGVLPLWNPFTYLGSPLAAAMQQSAFYPIEWLTLALFDPAQSLNAGLVLHLLLAAWGMTRWLRVATPLRGWALGAFGGLFPCLGWFWGHQEHINQIAAAAWMPWLAWLAWDRAAQRNGPRWIGLYATISAMQLLAGHPQAAAYSHMLAGLLLLARLGTRRGLRQGVALAAACALGGMIAAIQLLPTVELSRLSIRQIPDPAYSHSFSLPPDVLRSIVEPDAFGSFREGFTLPDGVPDMRAYNEYGLYLGIPLVLLAGIGALAGRSLVERRRAFFFTAIAVLFLLLALGGNTDPRRIAAFDFTESPDPGWSLHDLAIHLLPPLAKFRVPARAWVVTAFLALTLCTLGVAALHRGARRRAPRGSNDWPARNVVPALAFFFVFVLLAAGSLHEKFRHPQPYESRAVSSLFPFDDKGRLFRLWMNDDLLLAKMEREYATTKEMGNSILLREDRLQPNTHVLRGIAMEEGYEEGLLPTLRTKDFLFHFNRHFRSDKPDARFLALIGVSRIWTELPVDEKLFPRDGEFLANQSYVGTAFAKARTEGGDLRAFDGPFHSTGRYTGTRRSALVAYGEPLAWNHAAPRVAVDWRTPQRVELSAESPVEAILTMGAYPGWFIVQAEGARTPLQWLNAVHADVPKSAFVGSVATLVYEPASYRVGLFLSALATSLAALLFALKRRRAPAFP